MLERILRYVMKDCVGTATNQVVERCAARSRGSAFSYAAIRPLRFRHIFARPCSRKRRQQQTLGASSNPTKNVSAQASGRRAQSGVNSMNVPKRHHFLPLFYIKNFCIHDNDNRIWVIEKNKKARSFVTNIINSGCVTDYHKLDNDAEDPMIIEKTISKIESAQAQLVRKIIEKKSIDDKDKMELHAFIAFQRLRIPRFKEMVRKILQEQVLGLLEYEIKSGRVPEPPEVLKKEFEQKGIRNALKVEISNWKLLEYMLDPKQIDGQIALFTDMNTVLLFNNTSIPLITSDSPVSVFCDNYNYLNRIGWTYFENKTEFTIPITPNILILMKWNNDRNNNKMTENDVQEYNRRTIISSEKYLYSSIKDDNLVHQIVEHSGKYSNYEYSEYEVHNGVVAINTFIPIGPDI
jgi:hypothetical protein